MFNKFKYLHPVSLSSSKRSSDLEVVVDVSILASGVEGDVVLASVFCHCLNVNVTDVIN